MRHAVIVIDGALQLTARRVTVPSPWTRSLTYLFDDHYCRVLTLSYAQMEEQMLLTSTTVMAVRKAGGGGRPAQGRREMRNGRVINWFPYDRSRPVHNARSCPTSHNTTATGQER